MSFYCEAHQSHQVAGVWLLCPEENVPAQEVGSFQSMVASNTRTTCAFRGPSWVGATWFAAGLAESLVHCTLLDAP